jgi:NAD(P)-dependent dehydrogenase (short-subunit alcohol dehydrogenase family)
VRLQGELALVTGSTSGIGRAIALAYAAEGARVGVHGRDEGRGTAVVDEIAAAGGTAVFLRADLGTEPACTGLVADAVGALGGLTVLVNNAVASVVDSLAGGGHDTAVADIDTAIWEATLRVNVTAPMWLSRASIPHLRAAGHGSIINISSRQGERPSAGLAAYATSKGALNALTRAIAVEEARHRIRCTTISPGYVFNERRDADLTDERRARLEAMHLTRLGEAGDVAHAAVYLASSESEFLTGINLQLDGGGSIARASSLG